MHGVVQSRARERSVHLAATVPGHGVISMRGAHGGRQTCRSPAVLIGTRACMCCEDAVQPAGELTRKNSVMRVYSVFAISVRKLMLTGLKL